MMSVPVETQTRVKSKMRGNGAKSIYVEFRMLRRQDIVFIVQIVESLPFKFTQN